MTPKLPDFSFEKKLWNKGMDFVAGADEVGRGSFAGPVVCACVVFDKNTIYSFKDTVFKACLDKNEKGKLFKTELVINDSKKLTPKQREIADAWIRKNAHAFGIGKASVGQINRLGIKKATHIAYRKAVKNTEVSINHLLIDAFFVPYLKGLKTGRIKNSGQISYSEVRYSTNQTAIVNGDQKSFSIASASIIAKVYRDTLMKKLSKKKVHSVYNWHKNKGYGTLYHRLAIQKFGPTKHHRSDFIYSSFSQGQ